MLQVSTSNLMKSSWLSRLLFLTALLLLGARLHAAEEDDLIATLQSNASGPQKWAACQKLRIVGSPKAVPALAALLTDERGSQAARHALEALPYPEAGAALREALGRTTGLLKAGIVDSLGWRRELSALSALTTLVTDPDTTVAEEAAAALGRIGGSKAVDALLAVRFRGAIQGAVDESLLKCAEHLWATNDLADAALIYGPLYNTQSPVQVRTAAWRGLVLSDPQVRDERIFTALTGRDRPVQVAAQKLIRELGDRDVIDLCLRRWTALPVDSQLAVFDAEVKRGPQALPTARMVSQSPDAALRAAAWAALGDFNDLEAIGGLAHAAATGEPAEVEAARESLARLRGPHAREILLAEINKARAPEKAELLRALGERGDHDSADVLVQNAGAANAAVRAAALESLTKLAPAQAMGPLLDVAVKATSDEQREPVFKALYAICESSPDKVKAARSIIAKMGEFPSAERRQVLPLLGELATPEALTAAQSAIHNQDAELAKEAVRVLGQWPNAAPAGSLLDLARTSSDPTLKTLALRGAIDVVGQEPDSAKRFSMLQQALGLAHTTEEKKQALGQLARVPTPEALELVLKDLENPDLANEASLAAVSIAEKLAPSDPKLGDQVATKVLAQVKEGDVARRAWALRLKPSSGASFIRDWVVSGPYRQAGIVGAVGVFNIAFAPEKTNQKVEWQSVPPGNAVNLLSLFPGAENCAAYLRTELIAPDDVRGVLLLGSDDGIKAWLNSEVVHSNNVDRGQVADQDAAPIRLHKGTNELMLKITQGGGGWSACARVVGQDNKSIPGLLVQRPSGAAKAVAASAAQSTPPPAQAITPAELPPHDQFRTLRLSEQFYAEGAYYGDFNRDGKMDIVAGPFWFEGPDFQKRHEYRPAKAYDPKEYSDNFLTYTGDFNGDGWTDILCVPFPGVEGYWFENPKGEDVPWKKHAYFNNVGDESPVLADVTGDGRPELIFCKDDYLGYAGPDLSNPDAPWVFHAVSNKDKRYQRFTHGVGYGDINRDGRTDLVEAAGWWEQPADLKPDQTWIFHPFHFADAGAQMLVYDVNGDGLPDIITSWHCHLYGLVWWQQTKNSDGQIDWKEHVILTPNPDLSSSAFRVSQMHAMALADMNGDGVLDIVTGKRWWAHGPNGDKEPNAPAIVFWLELRRDGQGGATFVPHLIDDNSGVGTQVTAVDLNADGRPDVVVANKKGIFVHLNERSK